MHPFIIQLLWLIFLLIGQALLILPIFKHSKSVDKVTSRLGLLMTLLVVILAPLTYQPRTCGLLGLFLRTIGLIFFVVGVVIIIRGHKLIEKVVTEPGSREVPQKLIKTGIYSKIRNPILAGWILLAIGWSLMWGAVYSFFILPTVGFLCNIFTIKKIEEPILKKRFSREYEDYKNKVPAFFHFYLKGVLILIIIAMIIGIMTNWLSFD